MYMQATLVAYLVGKRVSTHTSILGISIAQIELPTTSLPHLLCHPLLLLLSLHKK
jgi:hypothetical protein